MPGIPVTAADGAFGPLLLWNIVFAKGADWHCGH